MTNLRHGQALYILVDDDNEKSRWLKSFDILRMMALMERYVSVQSTTAENRI
jgi:hypothetical protein